MSYQWSHGPRTWGRLLYYNFDCARLSVSSCSTPRTQRYKNNNDRALDHGLRDNYMLGYPTIDEHHPGTNAQAERLAVAAAEGPRQRSEVHRFIQRICSKCDG